MEKWIWANTGNRELTSTIFSWFSIPRLLLYFFKLSKIFTTKMAKYRYCSVDNWIWNLILHSIFHNWFNTGLASFLWDYIGDRLWALFISSIDNTAGLARSKKKSVEPFYNVLRSAFLWPRWAYRENFQNKTYKFFEILKIWKKIFGCNFGILGILR